MYSRLFTSVLRPISLLAVILLFLSSCSTKYAFSTSEVVPAATGSVSVKKDNNKNYKIKLKVRNLAAPGKLPVSKDVYVVWMETENSGTKNIGSLNTSSGMFSSKLKSSLQTVSPFEPRSFFITAENSRSIQYPDGQVVLRTK